MNSQAGQSDPLGSGESDQPRSLETCVVCGGSSSESVLRVDRTPVHPFHPPEVLDLSTRFGSLHIVICADCGHMYNAAFESALVADLYAGMVLTNTPVSESMLKGLESTAGYILDRAADDPIVLDVGGGTGTLAIALARRAQEVHLVEPSRVLQVGDFAAHGVTLHQSMFPADSLGDRVFDVAVAKQVLEHIPEPLPFLRSMADRLRDGGVAYVEVPSAEYIDRTHSIVDFHYPHVHFYHRHALEALFARAGFVVQEVVDVKDGHDRGFLLAKRDGVPVPPQHGGSNLRASALSDREELGRRRLGAIDGPVGLYGANAYSQALLGLYPEAADYKIMFDDTPMYHGQRAYGAGVDLPIQAPDGASLESLSAIVITSYLHDVIISEKLRAFGFDRAVFTVRADELAGQQRPPSLFHA